MAWLEQKTEGGTFHIRFRLGEEKFRRSLRTKDRREANTRCARVEENLRLVEAGRLVIPQEADVVTFLLSDGQLNGKLKPQKRVSLGQLFAKYKESLPEGALETNSLRIAEIHMRHFARTISKRVNLRSVTLEHLQKHINTRAIEPGKNGRYVSAGTIKKEISTFRTIWNWARGYGYVGTEFPCLGLKYPKTDEKPPFKTWEEITRELELCELSPEAKRELWHCLYLRADELTSLLDHVSGHSDYGFLFPMMATAAYTGARRSELCRIQVRDIDLTQKSIVIREKKRNKSRRTLRRVPIASTLHDVLDAWLQERKVGPYAFPCEWKVTRTRKSRENPGAVSPDEASHHLERGLKRTKWNVIAGWHVFRHSFISNCASLGVDQRMIDDWVGHQTDEQRRRYRHLFPDVQAEAINKVFS